MVDDRILNPEDLTIRQPLFWACIGFFAIGVSGGVWADFQAGFPSAVALDLASLVVTGVIAFSVSQKWMGIRFALGVLLYLGASNFLFALVNNLIARPEDLDAIIYNDLFAYSLFLSLAIFLAGRNAALGFGAILLGVEVVALVWGAWSAPVALNLWFEIPMTVAVTFLLYRYRGALDRLVRSQRQIIRENKALRERERLAALGELTAGISHEIKNPLNLVVNFAETSAMLLDDLEALLGKPNPGPGDLEERNYLLAELRQNMVDLRTQGLRGVSIVQSMLLHAREDRGDFRSVELTALVRESLQLVVLSRRSSAPPVGWNLTAPSEPVVVSGIPGDLARVVFSLSSNAFWAAAERAQQVPGGPSPAVTVTVSVSGPEARIAVRDNGVGLDPQIRDRLFVPFFTTKPPGEGTGLGLSLARDVVDHHQGRIEVEGRPGEGACFTVVLPREGVAL